MLLDLLEDPHEIRRICIMGRNCTLRKGNDDVKCSVPSEKQIAEEEEEEMEMLLENYLQRCESCHGHSDRLLDSAKDMEDYVAVNLRDIYHELEVVSRRARVRVLADNSRDNYWGWGGIFPYVPVSES